MTGDPVFDQVSEVVHAVLPSSVDRDEVARAITQGLLQCGLLRGANKYGKFDYLPQGVFESLTRIQEDATKAGPGSLESQRLSYYLYRLFGAGWTLESLGAALRISREGVRQRIRRAMKVELDAPVIGPPPPPEMLPQAPPPPPREITGEDVAELRRLHQIAVRYRGQMSPASPPAVAGRDLAALMNRLIAEDGFTATAVAKVMGITRNAVTFRLGRYGYGTLPPSQRDEGPDAGHPAA